MVQYVEIFSQGEEVITGQTVDSNAAWLSQQLVQMGFIVKRHTAVGDNLQDLNALLKEVAIRSDCCICTGGLGPTVDDLTAEAVAGAFARPLQCDPVALAQIVAHFTRRKRHMAEANRKQAFFPEGAERIDNDWGTAPGFTLQEGRCWFVFMPGVPSEMKAMFTAYIVNEVLQRFALQADQLVTLRSVGIGESDLQEKINSVPLPDTVQLGFRAGVDEVQTKLLFPAGTAQQQLGLYTQQLAGAIGDYVFAIDGVAGRQGGLVEVIDRLMQQQQLTLAIQETASQGLIAAKCIGREWLIASAFRRLFMLGEDRWSSDKLFNAAIKNAQQLQKQEGTELVLVQYYQGTAEQFQQKDQPIVIFNILLTPMGIQRTEFTLSGPQKRKQNQAAILALDLLRRYLQNKCEN